MIEELLVGSAGGTPKGHFRVDRNALIRAKGNTPTNGCFRVDREALKRAAGNTPEGAFHAK